MAAPGGDSRIITPYMPSLFNLTLVKIAVPLFNDFGFEKLESAFAEIQHGIPARLSEGRQENFNANTAAKKLLPIPAHLRNRVLGAVASLHCGVRQWKMDHSPILNLRDGERIFYWRADGTIDRTKTAQQLVLSENIHIRERSDIASMYCLHRNVRTLWADMDASGETENLKQLITPRGIFGLDGSVKDLEFLGCKLFENTSSFL
ncbi:hypothetical protein AVEN_36348-1 [Araneus ventricosus]|uniref:Uncharacterized protein n=1 Tax=Araneus ventricosus TaxID=182803 RepID=A0A4Y2RS60_ARAVE|nr:hypothetical protein AVEN_36348-1 [Araneus ventricosus]